MLKFAAVPLSKHASVAMVDAIAMVDSMVDAMMEAMVGAMVDAVVVAMVEEPTPLVKKNNAWAQNGNPSYIPYTERLRFGSGI